MPLNRRCGYPPPQHSHQPHPTLFFLLCYLNTDNINKTSLCSLLWRFLSTIELVDMRNRFYKVDNTIVGRYSINLFLNIRAWDNWVVENVHQNIFPSENVCITVTPARMRVTPSHHVPCQLGAWHRHKASPSPGRLCRLGELGTHEASTINTLIRATPLGKGH